MGDLSRIGVAIDTELLRRFDRFIAQKGYENRSEAFRDLIRDRLVGSAVVAPDAFVVKAFNTLFASLLANPVIDGIQLDGLYASDHDQAKAAALELVQAVGLRPIDAGALIMARTLEAMMLLNISLQIRNGWSWQNAWKFLGPTGA